MGLAAFKENIEQVTTPSLGTPKDVKAATQKLAEKSPIIATKLQTFAQNDPVQSEYNDDVSPDLNPRDILRIRSNRIVHKYESAEEREAEERQDNFGYTKNELARLVSSAYEDLYEDDASFEHYNLYSYQPLVVTAPPGCYAAHEQRYVAQNNLIYTPIYNEDGKLSYLDNGMECALPKVGLASTTPKMAYDDLIPKDRVNEINTKYDPATGKIVDRDANDAAIKLAFAREEAKYIELPKQLDMIKRISDEVTSRPAQNDPSFASAAPSGITAAVKPSEPFAAAASATDAPAAETKSIMFQTPRTPAPWEKVDKPASAAPSLTPAI